MTLPSFSSIELEALMVIATVLILAGAVVVLLFSAIVGTGLARLRAFPTTWRAVAFFGGFAAARQLGFNKVA